MGTPVGEMDLPSVDVLGLDRADAVSVLRQAAEKHWLARTPLGYAVIRYEDVVAVLRDRRWHSAVGLVPQMAGVDDEFFRNRQPSILMLEGEEHTRLRRLVSRAFTPRSADRLRPFMREVVADLFDPVAATGRCELVGDICEPYPIPIICELLGAPKEDWKLFSGWATDIFRIFNNDLANDAPAIIRASDELDTYIRALIDERRSQLGEDLLSDLIAAEEAGDRLSVDELVMLVEAVLMAGTDTTRNQLACAVALFTNHADQWAMLAEDPTLAPRAVEESMRHLGAVRGTMRVASEAIEYRDVEFPADSLMMASLAAANCDADVWDDTDRFDITRPAGTPQLTFGSGAHYCLGASLARAELQEALPLLAQRMPDLGLDGPIDWKPTTVGIWGPARLMLCFTPT